MPKPDMDKLTPRAAIDQLLAEARVYHTSEDYQTLLAFVGRLRAFAPFNAMLLHMQRPGLTYAASALDWRKRFNRTVKPRTIPLIILWPFGPVALVYDIVDTLGPNGSEELPRDIASFWACGTVAAADLDKSAAYLAKKSIYVKNFEGGDGAAGCIRLMNRAKEDKNPSLYEIDVNRNHPVSTRFCTLAHELAHLCLGHLGRDGYLRIPSRTFLSHPLREVEAESVAYLVATRNGIESDSKKYLAAFKNAVQSADELDLYQIMRAAGQVEQLLCRSMMLHPRIARKRA